MRYFILSLISVLLFAQKPPCIVPAKFVADRIFVTGTTVDGNTVTFWTDSGGGMMTISPAAANHLKLPLTDLPAGERSPAAKSTSFPAFRDLPGPVDTHALFVMPLDSHLDGDPTHSEGFLGAPWFEGRTWIFDYPAGRLLLLANGDPLPNAHKVFLGFKVGADGKRLTSFARLTVSVDGRDLDLLFDTGATAILTPEALKTLADGGPSYRGGSFIQSSVFEGWRKAHPDWKVIQNAEQFSGFPMIEVPKITVAGLSGGPVWFLRRPDAAFEHFMSSMTDKPVVGALGGSGLRYFRITVDYKRGIAAFEHPEHLH